MTRRGKFVTLAVWLLACFLASAEERGPDRRQLWVPRENLEAVLKKYPKAILLGRDEYEALVRDAIKPEPEEPEAPPVAAVVEEARFEGEVLEGFVRVRAEYEVESLTDEWAEVPLHFGADLLATAEIDEQMALRSFYRGVKHVVKRGDTLSQIAVDHGISLETLMEANKLTSDLIHPGDVLHCEVERNSSLHLLVQGKGRRTVRTEFHLPIERSAAGSQIQVPSPKIPAATLSLTFPRKVEVTSSGGFTMNSEGTAGQFGFSGDALSIRWSARDITDLEGTAIRQICRFIY